MSRFATMYDFEKCAPENQSYHKKLMKNQCGSGGNCRDEVEDPVWLG